MEKTNQEVLRSRNLDFILRQKKQSPRPCGGGGGVQCFSLLLAKTWIGK